jgi:hypothetical protein
MKQKVRKLGKFLVGWRGLVILMLLLGAVAIPATVRAACAGSVCDEWWGTVLGDFRDTTQYNNYVIHPPVDQLPFSGNGGSGSDDDGARISFIVNNSTNSAGTTLEYLPNQYFVSSTTPNLTFQMRGGLLGKADGARDRYDKASANPTWVIDYVKEQGYLSPVYYEVYQLTNGYAQDGNIGGKLLGTINPRDSNIFPTTDNGPNTNTDCKYVSNPNINGPCWRTFSINAPGGATPLGSVTNRITLDGSLQDSCYKRYINHNNQCYSGSAISYGGDGNPNARQLAQNDRIYGPEIWETRPELLGLTETALAVKQKDSSTTASAPKRDPMASLSEEARELVLGQTVKAADPTHPVHGFVSPNQKASGHVDISAQSGNGGQCKDANGNFVNKATKGFFGSTVDFPCKDGFNYTVSVSPQDFTYDQGGLDTGNCHIGDGDMAVNVGGGEATANFTYNCRHQIRVTVNPVAHTGGHAMVELTGGTCGGGNKLEVKDAPGQWDDGTALFTQCEDANYTAFIRTNSFYDDQGNYYCERVDNNSNYPDSQNFGNTQTPSALKYRCFPAVEHDGWISGGSFQQVDPTIKFDSANYPNLNGNYVFLIKAVNYEDLHRGYVTNYGDIYPRGPLYGGCPKEVDGNSIRCPISIVEEAERKGVFGNLIQDGYFLRTPRDVNGGKSYIASAPNPISFGVAWGPFGGEAAEPGEDHEYQEQAGQPYYGLRFQAGGAACRQDNWAHYVPQLDGSSAYNANPVFKAGNADWDGDFGLGPQGGFEGHGPANDHPIDAQVARLGRMSQDNVLDTTGHNPPDGNIRGVGNAEISSNWKAYPGWSIFLDDPTLGSNPFNTKWRLNETFTGRINVLNWNDGNNLYQGGAPFTWGFWPTCGQEENTPTLDLLTPKDGYTYDGTNSDNPTDVDGNGTYDYVEGTLGFKFNYDLKEIRGTASYRVDIFSDAGGANLAKSATGTQSNVQANTVNVPIQVGDLQRDTDYYWRACVSGRPGAGAGSLGSDAVCKQWRFRVNQGPAVVGQTGNSTVPNTNTQYPGSDRPNKGVYYKCAQLGSKLTDLEATPSQVRPYYTVSWNDGNGLNTVYSSVRQGTSDDNSWSDWKSGNYGYKNSGSSFTSDEVSPRQWRRGSSLASLSSAERNMSMTEFLQTKVPDGVDITWTARGEDRYGAGDLTNSLGPLLTLWQNSSPFTVANDAGPSADQQSPIVNRRFGLPISTNFHKNSAPNFSSASTKKFKDLSGNTITTATDGQTVNVEMTFVNGGETPTTYYALRDYLGSIRDFEQPSNITIRKNNGTTITLPTDQVLSQVIPDRTDIPNGSAAQNDTRNQNHDETVSNVDPKSANYTRASWRIELGSNQSGPLSDAAIGGVGNVMNPGDSITLTYQVRANRNQSLLSDDDGGEFQRTLVPTDTHAWAYYKENYCDSSDRTGKSINQLPGTVKAPWLRAQRGSVASNGGAFGYGSGQSNATFLVQANGILSHFTGGTGSLPNYTSKQAVCTAESGLPNAGERPGGVDWRRTMITNTGKLLDTSHHDTAETTTTFNSSSGNVTLNPSGGSNVWVAGSADNPTGLTLGHSESFKGVGTLVVFGDLNIGPNVSLTYQSDNGSINSLGIIVIGNVNIDPSVTNLVGNFYVLDSDVALDDDGCPVNIDEAKTTRGRFSTGSSANQLNVQGLVVAGAFDLLRYYLDPTDNTTDPAESFYYDGRVLANTPPGFGTFRNTASWQEIAP